MEIPLTLKVFRRKKKGEESRKPSRTISFPEIRDLSPEEEEIIERFARIIKSYGMELPATLFLYPMIPLSTIFSQTLLNFAAPFLELFGIPGYDYVSFFNKKENLERLINKVLEKDTSSKRIKLYT